jgi:2-keto-4-pentenoate hydratase/2-oxohepta-3-ene-1,7-dioic acid hydratase in catechol pathway
MKIFCVGRNYIDHAKELGNQVPDEPVIFMKPKNALLPAGMALMYPAFTNELHYECELVLKISKNGKFVSARHAHQYFNEITLGIDFTARDLQDKLKKSGLPWEKAKAFDHSAALGQTLPLSEVGPLNALEFKLYKNGELVQHGKVADMIFSPNDIVVDITNYFTINIGDLIFTGTPAGVGECVVGDVLEGYLNGDPILYVEIR